MAKWTVVRFDNDGEVYVLHQKGVTKQAAEEAADILNDTWDDATYHVAHIGVPRGGKLSSPTEPNEAI